MSKTKKLFSVLLAIAMVFSMLTVAASAATAYEDEEEAAEYTQDWALSEPVDNGDGTWSVDVLLTTNYATGPIQFVLTNTDTSVASIDDVILGDAIPESYNATVSVSKSKGKVMIISDTSADNTITAEEIDGVIATVVYAYSGEGSAEIAIDDNAKSATNIAGTLIAARMSDGDIVTGEPIVGQTVTVGEAVIIGGGAAPELAVVEGTIGVIDTSRTMLDEDNGIECNGYLLGFDPDANGDVSELFEVIGDGEMNVVENEAGSLCGTGTMVEVLDLDGEVVASYVLIVFGDVNGDGFADATDADDILSHDAWMLGDTGRLLTYADFAGDVNIDGFCDATDADDVLSHDAWVLGDLGRIDVAGNIAALGF